MKARYVAIRSWTSESFIPEVYDSQWSATAGPSATIARCLVCVPARPRWVAWAYWPTDEEVVVNRETKRLLQRQGAVDEAGAPVRAPRSAPAPKAAEERTPPMQYVREVQGELKKVNWPTRDEIKNYSIVVLVTLVVMTAITFAFDYSFSKLVLFLFDR